MAATASGAAPGPEGGVAEQESSSCDHRDDVPSSGREAGARSGTAQARVANADIEISRRAVPVLCVEEDVCSICLDEFTTDDPAAETTCSHNFHLQCVMQWAQRSRECPMCFKSLQLKDDDLNGLLPFGEYVPPERAHRISPQLLVGMNTWELERLLARIAASSGAPPRERRRVGSSMLAVGVHSTSSQDAMASGRGAALDTGDAIRGEASSSASARGRHSLARACPGSGSSGSAARSSAEADVPQEAMRIASWPPPSTRGPAALLKPHEAEGPGRAVRGGVGGADSLRARWLAAKEQLARTVKGRWGGAKTPMGAVGTRTPPSPPPTPATSGRPAVGPQHCDQAPQLRTGHQQAC